MEATALNPAPEVAMRMAVVLLVSVLLPAGGVAASAAEPPEDESVRAGAVVFKVHCAKCHGESGKGDGKAAPGLEFVPADLTRISQRNRGKFPFERVVQIVDGRKPMKGHGRTDMPAWGDMLLSEREGYDKDKVKEQIRRVVRYVESIQETPGPR
jgi:mono/diheme cytochrome c family protein